MSGQQPGRFARALTLIVTSAIKVVGLVAATYQLLFATTPHTLPLIVSAFMMAGAQFSEGLILHVLDRMFVGQPPGGHSDGGAG